MNTPFITAKIPSNISSHLSAAFIALNVCLASVPSNIFAKLSYKLSNPFTTKVSFPIAFCIALLSNISENCFITFGLLISILSRASHSSNILVIDLSYLISLRISGFFLILFLKPSKSTFKSDNKFLSKLFLASVIALKALSFLLLTLLTLVLLYPYVSLVKASLTAFWNPETSISLYLLNIVANKLILFVKPPFKVIELNSSTKPTVLLISKSI